MSGLNNTWIGYFDRSYQQAKAAITTRLGIVAPELSDHTESNPLIIVVDIFLGISELLHYYIDNVAREVYLHSARQYKSAQKIAKLFNYRLKGYSSASASVRFSITEVSASPILIPVGTTIKSDDLVYVTTASVILPSGQLFVDAVAIQELSGDLSATSDGMPKQKVQLPKDTVDLSVSVSLDGIQYIFKNDLLLSNATDTHFTTEVGEDQYLYVVFGDGISGLIPPLGGNISIEYKTSSGSLGNVPLGAIDTIDSALVSDKTVSVINTEAATGGDEIQTLDNLKKLIPSSIRTLNRAVTEQDFKDISEGVSGVSQAFVAYDCGAEVDIYIVPTGLGEATTVLRDNVRAAFYDETRLILMDINVLPAGRISALVSADLVVLDVYNAQAVQLAVTNNLTEFLSSANQTISGSVRLGDVYQIIENTEGVDYCEVSLLSTIPQAINDIGFNVLIWDRELLVGSTNQATWNITMVSITEYALRRGSVLVGTYSLGQEVVLAEVKLTVSDNNYDIGNSWNFVTYKYNGSIELDEPSIITIESSNIQLNTSGGV